MLPDDSGRPHCLHSRQGVWQASLAVSCLVAGGMSCCHCGAFVSSLSEHVSPEQSDGVPLAGLGPHIDLQPVVRSGSSFAARVGRQISVLARGSKGGASSLHANSLKVGALCVALALVLRGFAVVGTVFSSLVWWLRLRRAYRPSNEHEDGRPVAWRQPGWYRINKPPRHLKWLSDHHCEFINNVLPPLKDPPNWQKTRKWT